VLLVLLYWTGALYLKVLECAETGSEPG